MAFILIEEDPTSSSYRLVNLDQVLTAELSDVKTPGGARCVLHMADKGRVELNGRDVNLALDTINSSANIQNFVRSSHYPR